MKRKRSWSKADDHPQTISKPELTANKVMLNVWWDREGIIYYELLKCGKTINSTCTVHKSTAWTKKSRDIDQNWPTERELCSIMAMRGHTFLITRNKLTSLGWEVLMPPPYSQHLAPSDYHLFRALQNSLGGKNWPTETLVKITWSSFSTISHRRSTTMELWIYAKMIKGHR